MIAVYAKEPTRRRVYWIIFIVAVALRVYWINVPALWYDENFSLLVARLPFDRAIDAIKGDVHPPLWYLILWTIYHIAPNLPPWFIRVPALIFSLASLPMFVIVMRKLHIPPAVEIAAIVLMAVMPFQIWYAQEGRMYAMLQFLVLFTLSAALGRAALSMFLGALALLYTQNYGPFYLLCIALVVIVQGYKSKSWRDSLNSLAAFVPAVMLWLPWLWVITSQMNEIAGRYWIISKSFGSILVIVYKLFLTAAVPSPFFFYSYLVTFAAWILGAWYFVRSTHPQRLTIAIMACLPLCIAWVASIVWQPVLLFRPLIGISPFLYVITAWSQNAETTAN